MICLFETVLIQIDACLFVYSFFPNSRIFHSFGDVTITGEGLQYLTYARHSWPLSSEGSLACHTYCDTWHPFIMIISEDPLHSHLMPSVWQWSCLNNVGESRLGFNGANALTHCATAAATDRCLYILTS